MERDELIFNYLDNLCTPKERQEVEHLLATDKEFKHLFAEIKQMNDLMLETPLEQAPSNFAAGVINAIQQSEGVQFVQQSNLIKVLVGIMAALCLLVSFNLMNINLPAPINQIMSLFSIQYIFCTIILLSFWAGLEFFLIRKDMKNQ